MVASLYCSADKVSAPGSGGAVTYHEALALSAIGPMAVVDRTRIEPSLYGMPDSPYLYDTIADAVILNDYLANIQFAHFYAGTFSRTITRLRGAGRKTSYTAAAHDPNKSREEFEALGIPYTFPHITIPHLWSSYIEGYLAADLVICPSTHSAGLMQSFGCTNVQVIPHGVDLPATIPPQPTAWNVGYLGQAGPDKGLRYLFQAWKKLNWRDSRLIIAGKNEQALPLFRAEGGGNFELKGWVESPTDLYSAVSAYVQPSVSEGFGMEVLEAMAHGRPVVVSEGAGAADVVTDGVDGFVVPIRDPDAIADRLQRLRDDKALFQSMALAAIEKARQYEWSIIRGKYIEAWSKLLESFPRLDN